MSSNIRHLRIERDRFHSRARASVTISDSTTPEYLCRMISGIAAALTPPDAIWYVEFAKERNDNSEISS